MAALPPALRLLDPRLRVQIENSHEQDALRRFACACADHAIVTCDLRDEVLVEGLHIALDWPSSALDETDLERVREAVTLVVKRLDDEAFAAQVAAEDDSASREKYSEAFRRARAASSVLASMQDSAIGAAADACYEAYHATRDIEALIATGSEILGSYHP
jgi:hypothetical protein